MPISANRDRELLRRAIALSRQARERGDHPFGALLADPDGTILLEALNTCGTVGDRTGHAERNLMTEASKIYDAEFLGGCSMYTSAEPCAMCAGAVYWAGVGRVVYGLSQQALKELVAPETDILTLDLSCQAVLAAGQGQVSVVGPLLMEEAAVVHDGFWTGPKD